MLFLTHSVGQFCRLVLKNSIVEASQSSVCIGWESLVGHWKSVIEKRFGPNSPNTLWTRLPKLFQIDLRCMSSVLQLIVFAVLEVRVS